MVTKAHGHGVNSRKKHHRRFVSETMLSDVGLMTADDYLRPKILLKGILLSYFVLPDDCVRIAGLLREEVHAA
jgi:hypothetical protein